jgi:hypothetical protein
MAPVDHYGDGLCWMMVGVVCGGDGVDMHIGNRCRVGGRDGTSAALPMDRPVEGVYRCGTPYHTDAALTRGAALAIDRPVEGVYRCGTYVKGCRNGANSNGGIRRVNKWRGLINGTPTPGALKVIRGKSSLNQLV